MTKLIRNTRLLIVTGLAALILAGGLYSYSSAAGVTVDEIVGVATIQGTEGPYDILKLTGSKLESEVPLQFFPMSKFVFVDKLTIIHLELAVDKSGFPFFLTPVNKKIYTPLAKPKLTVDQSASIELQGKEGFDVLKLTSSEVTPIVLEAGFTVPIVDGDTIVQFVLKSEMGIPEIFVPAKPFIFKPAIFEK